MLTLEQAVTIQILHQQGKSIKAITREMGVSGICQHSCHPYLNQATKTSVALTRLDGRTGLRAVG